MREIKFYRTKSGTCPVEEFLDSLNAKQAQKVMWVLKLIKELERVPVQYFKKLVNTDDLWEVRIQIGNNIFRLLGFFYSGNLVVLCHGFTKKTEKTPVRDIEVAEERKQDYLSRTRRL